MVELGNRRGDDALWPKLLEEPSVLAPQAAASDVLAQHPYARIAAHLLLHGQPAGLDEAYRCHATAPVSCTSA